MPDPNLPAAPGDEVALRSQLDKNQFDYAMRNLELTAQDRREERMLSRHSQQWGIGFLAFTVLAFLGFCWLALSFGKDGLVADVIKVAAAFLGGGGLGYAFGFRKRQQAPAQNPK